MRLWNSILEKADATNKPTHLKQALYKVQECDTRTATHMLLPVLQPGLPPDVSAEVNPVTKHCGHYTWGKNSFTDYSKGSLWKELTRAWEERDEYDSLGKKKQNNEESEALLQLLLNSMWALPPVPVQILWDVGFQDGTSQREDDLNSCVWSRRESLMKSPLLSAKPVLVLNQAA